MPDQLTYIHLSLRSARCVPRSSPSLSQVWLLSASPSSEALTSIQRDLHPLTARDEAEYQLSPSSKAHHLPHAGIHLRRAPVVSFTAMPDLAHLIHIHHFAILSSPPPSSPRLSRIGCCQLLRVAKLSPRISMPWASSSISEAGCQLIPCSRQLTTPPRAAHDDRLWSAILVPRSPAHLLPRHSEPLRTT